jgi:hypothetical protein
MRKFYLKYSCNGDFSSPTYSGVAGTVDGTVAIAASFFSTLMLF